MIILTEYEHLITELTLTPSSGGVFEIDKNCDMIDSKKSTGNLPDKDRIIKIFQTV
ncbi:MAG: hypothetical protein GF372_06680 [Candidatus Marinimicrobia bacterium]|nr:hypothetical protein [Candidatus Neomarinimicrobiota bacterium]